MYEKEKYEVLKIKISNKITLEKVAKLKYTNVTYLIISYISKYVDDYKDTSIKSIRYKGIGDKLYIRVPKDLCNKLDALSEGDDLKRAQLVRLFINKGLSEELNIKDISLD